MSQIDDTSRNQSASWQIQEWVLRQWRTVRNHRRNHLSVGFQIGVWQRKQIKEIQRIGRWSDDINIWSWCRNAKPASWNWSASGLIDLSDPCGIWCRSLVSFCQDSRFTQYENSLEQFNEIFRLTNLRTGNKQLSMSFTYRLHSNWLLKGKVSDANKS